MEDSRMDLSNTFGPALIGYLFSLVLYGTSSTQIFIYLSASARGRSRRPLTYVVALLWLLDTLEVVLVGHAIYYYLIECNDDGQKLQKPNWSLIAMMFPSIWTIGLVQYLWIMRIWTLSRYKWRTVIAYAMLFSLALDCVISHVWTVQCFYNETFEEIPRSHLWETALIVGLVTFNDLVQTLYFCHLLHRSRDGLYSTNTLINRLIWYGANTGIATCFASVTLLIVILILPDTFYYMAVCMILQKLYINSLMAMLNWPMPSSRLGEVQRSRHQSESQQLTTVVLEHMSCYTQFPDENSS